MGKFFNTKGKFFNTKIAKDKSTLIKYGLIGLGVFIILIIIIAIAGKSGKSRFEVYEYAEEIEVSSDPKNFPEIEELIKSFGKAKQDEIVIDYNDLDTSVIGEYAIYLKYNNNTYEVSISVVDTTPPEANIIDKLIPKDSNTYKLSDFIQECTDNDPKTTECTYIFNDETIHTEKGSYEYKLKVCDNSNNCTEEKTVTVEIGGHCMFGSLEYDKTKNKYPLAVTVGDVTNNCAVDKKLWQSTEFLNKVNDLYSTDLQLLQSQLDSIIKNKFPEGAITKAFPSFITIYNSANTGLVGYAIRVNVYAQKQGYTGKLDTDDNLILTYSLDSNGKRIYEYNAYGID